MILDTYYSDDLDCTVVHLTNKAAFALEYPDRESLFDHGYTDSEIDQVFDLIQQGVKDWYWNNEGTFVLLKD